MKIAVIFTGHHGVQKAADRFGVFVQPFISDKNQLEAWYLGDVPEDRDYLSEHAKGVTALFVKLKSFLPPIFAENHLDALETFYAKRKPELLLFYGQDNGLAVRFGARISGKTLTNCAEACAYAGGVEVTRRVYNANIDGVYALKCFPVVLTVSKTGPTAKDEGCLKKKVPMAEIDVEKRTYGYCLEHELKAMEGRNPLEEAELVLVGGRGLGSKENYERLERLAKAWGGACGCTRAAAINGFAPADCIVGQSGRVLGAALCITFGVSGAGPFMAGVENVKTLAAINTDENAPIFSGADYGILGDALEALEAFEKCKKGASE